MLNVVRCLFLLKLLVMKLCGSGIMGVVDFNVLLIVIGCGSLLSVGFVFSLNVSGLIYWLFFVGLLLFGFVVCWINLFKVVIGLVVWIVVWLYLGCCVFDCIVD